MRYYTHIALGILLYTLFVWLIDQPFTIAGILFTAWISIMPDLIEKVIGEHRSWGHSIIWLIPVIASFFLNIQIGIAFASGFLGHILLDIVTKKGVPFLYPFKKTRMVMPQKEKSRIQTGSKQEKALCLVIILILVPLAYGVLYGMPNFGEIASGNNSSLNKTNSSNALSNLIDKITGNLKSNGTKSTGYKTSNYTPYTKTNAVDKTTDKITPNTTTTDDTSSLIDWLTDNPIIDQTQNNTNNNNNNTNTNTTNTTNSTEEDLLDLLDPLFDDMSNAAAGGDLEQNITMEDDSQDYVPDDYDPTNNPDTDYYDDGGDSSEGDEGGWFDFFLTVTPLFKVKL
jgi:membrane-bound metal-dependent hydrolase YbcI (DUF457 family)